MQAHEITIVGAGFAGAATAWHLARLGVRDVVLLEREATPGVHSSGRNACFVREYSEEPYWRALLSEGATVLRTGDLAPFRQNGSVLLGLGEDDVSQWVPPARGQGLWCPDDGVVDVAALLATYLDGRDVHFGCALLGWREEGDHLVLETSAESFETRILVNAAGPWAGEVGRLALTPLNRHIFVTEPMEQVDAAWPFVWDVPRGVYFRPESRGLLLSPCDETPAPPGCYEEDPRALETLAERLAATQPELADVHVAYRWVGQRTFAKDRKPVIGFDPRTPRLFHVAGLGGHGVTASFAVGALAARCLVDRVRPRPDLEPGRLLEPA